MIKKTEAVLQMCSLKKVLAEQLYQNHTTAWLFSCKFTAYFQNTFFEKHL